MYYNIRRNRKKISCDDHDDRRNNNTLSDTLDTFLRENRKQRDW